MDRDPRILTHPGLQPLWDAMERERRQQQTVAVITIVGGLAAVVIGILQRSMLVPLLGGLAATAGLGWLYYVLTVQPLVELRGRLRKAPEDFVWVYSTVTQRFPFGLKTTDMGTLYLVDDKGNCESFDLQPQDVKLVTKTLNRVLPRAEFGFSEERERKYLPDR